MGLDLSNAVYPQTLRCYELNGRPLDAAHGAPLRLVAPLRYGTRHRKRIGTIAFADARPADCWAEQGHDRGSGHRGGGPARLALNGWPPPAQCAAT